MQLGFPRVSQKQVRIFNEQLNHLLVWMLNKTTWKFKLMVRKKLPMKTSSYLANWQQDVDVVWSNKVLTELQNCPDEGLFAMMVGRHLSDWSGELRNFYFAFVVPLEADIHDLPLAGLEAVDDARDRTLYVQIGVPDQLFVDEVLEEKS